MRDSVLWRKIARIIIMISEGLDISSERALDLFYRSKVYEMLVDPKFGFQTMSDTYIYDEFILEMQRKADASKTSNS